MQITFEQAEIEQALREFCNRQISLAPNQKVEFEFTTTRNPSTTVAKVIIKNAEFVTSDAPQEEALKPSKKPTLSLKRGGASETKKVEEEEGDAPEAEAEETQPDSSTEDVQDETPVADEAEATEEEEAPSAPGPVKGGIFGKRAAAASAAS